MSGEWWIPSNVQNGMFKTHSMTSPPNEQYNDSGLVREVTGESKDNLSLHMYIFSLNFFSQYSEALFFSNKTISVLN